MNRDKFLNCSIKQIFQVYKGKQNACRCGCAGDYYSTSYMIYPRGEVNNKLVEKYLLKAKRLVLQEAEVFYNEKCVDVTTGKNKTLTFYFDEFHIAS